MRLTYLIMMLVCSLCWGLEVTPVEKPIYIKSNFLEINLPSKNKHDYTWYLDDDVHSFLRPVSQRFTPLDRQDPNGAGIVTWRFQVLSHAFQVPMMFKLHFDCRQKNLIEPFQQAEFTLLARQAKSEQAGIKNWVHDILFGEDA